MSEAFDHQRDEVDFCLGAALEGDLHDPPVYRCGLVIPRDIVASNHVQDNVGPMVLGYLFHHLDEVLFLVIDGAGRAEFFAGGAFLRATGRHDNPCAECHGKLDSRRSNAG